MPVRHRAAAQRAFVKLPLAAAILAFGQAGHAQEPGSFQLDEVIVTAQKRSENLQDVPISIQALGQETLSNLGVKNFSDYAKMLPSVSFDGSRPGGQNVYMRGIVSGNDGNHSGSQPSVGVYLDEQPITTIGGTLDVHVYDIARVESLAGPQGTLYGASAQAGTLRIITNKPDTTGFSAGYGLEGNYVEHGDFGGVSEGFVNLPVTDSVAVRLVGWAKRDAGYLDNVHDSRTYTNLGVTSDNAGVAEDDANQVDTYGGRAALRWDINEDWSVTPAIMGQKQEQGGSFSYDASRGDKLEYVSYRDEYDNDDWYQAALTIEGRIGNFDIVYAGSDLTRQIDSQSDYSDYSYWYNEYFVNSFLYRKSQPFDPAVYGAEYSCYLFFDTANSGYCGNPDQYIKAEDTYGKTSHELRISSPQEDSLRVVAGYFWQEQTHDIQQDYKVDGVPPSREITGWSDSVWLTRQEREDKDEAVFGEVSWDIVDSVTATYGLRRFKSDNSLKGFFGYGLEFPYSGGGGERRCIDQADFNGAPCTVFDKATSEDDKIHRYNLTWRITEDYLVYLTRSEGYRPGGINRRGTLPPYQADYLTSWEIGWKTTWLDGEMNFNGAAFSQSWDEFQFSIVGPNGLTEIRNAAQAKVDGVELELQWAASEQLMITSALAVYDPELDDPYCGYTDSAGNSVTDCADPEAPAGQQLPITSTMKGNLTARYEFNLGGYDAFVQGAVVYEGDRQSDLRSKTRDILGELPSYTLVDVSAGMNWESYGVEFYIRNLTDELVEQSRGAGCIETVCARQNYTGNGGPLVVGQVYVATVQPRTFGLRWHQDFD